MKRSNYGQITSRAVSIPKRDFISMIILPDFSASDCGFTKKL